MNEIEELWDSLLSQEAVRILTAYNSLQPDEKEAIRSHLARMTKEEGWQPSQMESAQTALDVIEGKRT